MATAKVLQFHDDDGTELDSLGLSVAETLQHFTAQELLAASQETSNIFNGMVLARAVAIVQARTRCFPLLDFGQRLCIAKNSVYRWAKGKPVSRAFYERAMMLLAVELGERGVS